MRQVLLIKKSQQPNHPFDPSDLKDMVKEIQKPIAIFKYTKDNVMNLIISLNSDGKHFLVGITLGFKRGDLEINSISELFPKQNHEWIKWIQDGLAVRMDQKEKVLQLIDSLRINPAEAKRIGLDLDRAAKIVENFENPSIDIKKVQQIIAIQRTTNTVESERIELNLDQDANIVENFENPRIEDKK